MDPLLRTGKDLEDIYQRHVDMLYRVAYSFMKNGADAEDMVQETFLRLMRSGTVFESAQHEKAWLIVTVSNLCKSALRSPWRRREDLDALSEQPTTEDTAPDETLQAVLALPDDSRHALAAGSMGDMQLTVLQRTGAQTGAARMLRVTCYVFGRKIVFDVAAADA